MNNTMKTIIMLIAIGFFLANIYFCITMQIKTGKDLRSFKGMAFWFIMEIISIAMIATVPVLINN